MKITGDKDFDRFWAAWSKWVPHRKTDKGQAHTEFKKALKEVDDKEKLIFDIVSSVEYQAKARRHAKEKKVFIPDFPAPHRFLKNKKWLDEISSHEEIERKIESNQCDCGAKAFTKVGKWYCERCWSNTFTNTKHVLTEGLKLNGGKYMKKKEETREEWIQRVKAAASQIKDRFGST